MIYIRKANTLILTDQCLPPRYVPLHGSSHFLALRLVLPPPSMAINNIEEEKIGKPDRSPMCPWLFADPWPPSQARRDSATGHHPLRHGRQDRTYLHSLDWWSESCGGE